MRVAVVGAGAIGGFLAGALAHAGISVAVVARGRHLEAIAQRGLRVAGDLGDFTVRVDAANDLRELGDFDYLLLTFKAHQWTGFIPQLSPYAGTATRLVTMQNGLPFWYVRDPSLRSVDPNGTVAQLFSDEQTIGSVVHVSGEILEPGYVRQSGGVRYVFGSPGGGANAALESIAVAFRSAGLNAEIDTNVRQTVWLKLVNNTGLNAVSALRGLTIKPMLEDPAVRAYVAALMHEALAVGQAMGVVGDVDVEARIAYAARLDNVRTSMLQDVEQRRALELDPILGAVCELGERYGVATPLVREAYGELQRLSATWKSPV